MSHTVNVPAFILVYCDDQDRKHRGYAASPCDERGRSTEAAEGVGPAIGGRAFAAGPTPPARVVTAARAALQIPRCARITWERRNVNGGSWLGTVSARA
jgi:hypothetical protein